MKTQIIILYSKSDAPIIEDGNDKTKVCRFLENLFKQKVVIKFLKHEENLIAINVYGKEEDEIVTRGISSIFGGIGYPEERFVIRFLP